MKNKQFFKTTMAVALIASSTVNLPQAVFASSIENQEIEVSQESVKDEITEEKNEAPELTDKIVKDTLEVTNDEGVEEKSETENTIQGTAIYVIEDGKHTIGEHTFYTQNGGELYKYEGSGSGELIIPEGVTSISSHVFQWQYFTSLTLPSTMQKIGDYAFAGDAVYLREIVFNEGLKHIGDYAFSGSGNWGGLPQQTIHFPSTLEYLGEGAFSNNFGAFEFKFSGQPPIFGNNWQPEHAIVFIPDTLAWNNVAIENLGNVIINKDTKIIKDGEHVFYVKENVLEHYNGPGGHIVIPNGIKVIGGSSFWFEGRWNVTNITLPEGVEEIEAVAFSQSPITKLVIPSTVTKIGSSAFKSTGSGDLLEEIHFKRKTADISFGFEWLGSQRVKEIKLYLPNTESWKAISDEAISSLNFGKLNFQRIYTEIANTKPVISGANNFILPVGTEFKPLEGVSASDAEDGDLTHAIEVSGIVNRYQLGEYPITYTVTDSNGNTSSVERIVSVDYTNPTDWTNNWASPYIRIAMEKGWITTSDTFRPEDNITRAEFVKIVNKAFGYTELAESEPFGDVKEPHWFYQEILIAVKAGYISTSSNYFRPNETITREEVAAIITNIKGNKDMDFDKIQQYSDYNEISSWARDSVEGVVEAGYMGKGSDKFRPKSPISRAEAVVTLGRVFE